uniref:Uncharacterized protein n=1 Tax=Triticum urartu TaxID=4572 RepID=A0A8R7JVP4_TRIUA
MESCDELAWERDDLRKRLRDAPDLTEQVQAPQRDKKILKTNLKKAKERLSYLRRKELLTKPTRRYCAYWRRSRNIGPKGSTPPAIPPSRSASRRA